MKKNPTYVMVMALLILLLLIQCIAPTRDMSELENRVLEQKPELAVKTILNGDFTSGTEAFVADQFPLRDSFVQLYTTMQRAMRRKAVNNTIIGAEGRYFEQTDAWSSRNVILNTDALSALSSLSGKPVSLLAVPSAAAVYPEYLPANAPITDEQKLIAGAKDITVFPLYEALYGNRSRQLYYHTDHHWTMEGAWLGYATACEAFGLNAMPVSNVRTVSGFWGSYYARYPLPGVPGDTLSFCDDPSLTLFVNGVKKDGLVDETALAKRDKYAALLYGNHAQVEIINDAVSDGTLMIIKDSYANAILPMLARHYHRIIAIDPRYYAGDIVEIAAASESEVILCVYGLSTLATGRSIALLEGLY